MSELQRLQELNQRLQLVPNGSTVDQLERSASNFTNEAAKMLHGEGWRRIRKTEGKNVDGLDIDKLVNETTGELRDIIVAAGASSAFVAWQFAGHLADRDRYIEVRPDEAPNSGHVDPPPTNDDSNIEVADAVDHTTDAIRQLDRTLQALVEEAGIISAALLRLSERVPL